MYRWWEGLHWIFRIHSLDCIVASVSDSLLNQSLSWLLSFLAILSLSLFLSKYLQFNLLRCNPWHILRWYTQSSNHSVRLSGEMIRLTWRNQLPRNPIKLSVYTEECNRYFFVRYRNCNKEKLVYLDFRINFLRVTRRHKIVRAIFSSLSLYFSLYLLYTILLYLKM